jgi:hypothetical protein
MMAAGRWTGPLWGGRKESRPLKDASDALCTVAPNAYLGPGLENPTTAALLKPRG